MKTSGEKKMSERSQCVSLGYTYTLEWAEVGPLRVYEVVARQVRGELG